MGGVMCIAIALWLLAFAAGVYLLYKTQKENLSVAFKVAGWFVVVAALCGMLCCTFMAAMHGCCNRERGMGMMPPMPPHAPCMMQNYGGGACAEDDQCPRWGHKQHGCSDEEDCDEPCSGGEESHCSKDSVAKKK